MSFLDSLPELAGATLKLLSCWALTDTQVTQVTQGNTEKAPCGSVCASNMGAVSLEEVSAESAHT